MPLIGRPLGAPALRMLRSWRRGGEAAVLGTWAEARDRLRAYGVPITPGMTVRDLGGAVSRPAGDDLDEACATRSAGLETPSLPLLALVKVHG